MVVGLGGFRFDCANQSLVKNFQDAESTEYVIKAAEEPTATPIVDLSHLPVRPTTSTGSSTSMKPAPKRQLKKRVSLL